MTGDYRTIVIDPPWPIETGKVPDAYLRKTGRWASSAPPLEYSTLPVDMLRSFPMDEYAAEDCILFLWVTTGKVDDVPVIRLGFDLLEMWGFKYHQTVTWAKEAGFSVWSPFCSRTEHVLVGYRGYLPKVYGVMPNYFVTGQLSHSEKPDKFYQMLREWTPEPRIDLFARKAREGFEGWGREYVGEGPLARFLEAEEEG